MYYTIEIKPMSSGAESEDCAEVLLRMYLKYLEKEGFKISELYHLPGEYCGIKECILEVSGRDEQMRDFLLFFGSAETGLHRFVRLSPFDAEKRRYTSFVAVQVLTCGFPLDSNDIQIMGYKPSGIGGQQVWSSQQHIKLTHLPTEIYARSSGSSFLKTKEAALKILQARVHMKAERKEFELRPELIRSYVFDPYQLATDHRKFIETEDLTSVLNGNIELLYQY